MLFIKPVTVASVNQHPFPFCIPAVQFAKQVAINAGVTIFAGDNGPGKSTLLETMVLCTFNSFLCKGAYRVMKTWFVQGAKKKGCMEMLPRLKSNIL
jgi:predicted ATPase